MMQHSWISRAIVKKKKIVLITDEHIYDLHKEKFRGYAVIKIRAGEENKTQHTIDHIIKKLLALEADKQTFIVGVGGE